ncbi:MAG: hypothetical protein ACQEQQ_05090 [Chloroflexota bacterium]
MSTPLSTLSEGKEETASPQPTSETSPQSTKEESVMGAAESARKGNADVVHVRVVEQEEENMWTFYVTLQHPDKGWEDYANGWDVVIPGGEVLKKDPEDPFTRLLLHPHVEEQPFTRSQSDLFIPPDVTKVRVRAHDLVDGYGGEEVEVDLTQPSGPGYEVER